MEKRYDFLVLGFHAESHIFAAQNHPDRYREQKYKYSSHVKNISSLSNFDACKRSADGPKKR
jgi:hypothetical protein